MYFLQFQLAGPTVRRSADARLPGLNPKQSASRCRNSLASTLNKPKSFTPTKTSNRPQPVAEFQARHFPGSQLRLKCPRLKLNTILQKAGVFYIHCKQSRHVARHHETQITATEMHSCSALVRKQPPSNAACNNGSPACTTQSRSVYTWPLLMFDLGCSKTKIPREMSHAQICSNPGSDRTWIHQMMF